MPSMNRPRDSEFSELHVHPGCPHGFDRVSTEVDVVRRARADRVRALRSF
jgi:hypothetical protein